MLGIDVLQKLGLNSDEDMENAGEHPKIRIVHELLVMHMKSLSAKL